MCTSAVLLLLLLLKIFLNIENILLGPAACVLTRRVILVFVTTHYIVVYRYKFISRLFVSGKQRRRRRKRYCRAYIISSCVQYYTLNTKTIRVMCTYVATAGAYE